MIDQLSDDRILQHHVAHSDFDIDHQAVYFTAVTQAHGADYNVVAFV